MWYATHEILIFALCEIRPSGSVSWAKSRNGYDELRASDKHTGDCPHRATHTTAARISIATAEEPWTTVAAMVWLAIRRADLCPSLLFLSPGQRCCQVSTATRAQLSSYLCRSRGRSRLFLLLLLYCINVSTLFSVLFFPILTVTLTPKARPERGFPALFVTASCFRRRSQARAVCMPRLS